MRSIYVAGSAEVNHNWLENRANRWYKAGLNAEDNVGQYAFQRLRQTWFTPQISPKFRFERDDKFYAIGSCFARGIEQALTGRGVTVESMAPEFVKLQPVNKEVTGLGFTNKYNTFSILNELRWALDPEAAFPVDSIFQVTESTWFDPHLYSHPRAGRIFGNAQSSCIDANSRKASGAVPRFDYNIGPGGSMARLQNRRLH